MEYISHSVEQTLQLGFLLGQALQPGHLVCLSGELGAGKTTLVRGIGRGWQSLDRITSPTYVLLNIYRRQVDAQQLYHLDAYRLEGPTAVEAIGFDDILEAYGPLLIEWPERIQAVLPPHRLWIEIDRHHDERRIFHMNAEGLEHNQLLELVRKAL